MSLVAPPAVDLREEMDESVAPAKATGSGARRKPNTTAVAKPGDAKTSFLIRTLPRECNPTPVAAGGLSASASGVLSPLARKRGSRQETEMEALQEENPFDDISEEKLQQLTGSHDLGRVTSLQLSVDSTKQSVEVIGELLPALQQLRLQQSTLCSFRDLGTSLGSLRILWAVNCGIADLDGIGALVNLQELYLQHNRVSDISPLTMHDELRVVDLEGNCVSDIGQIEQLAFCPQLTALNLSANPVVAIGRYRQIIANFVPQLASLDDRAFTDGERAKLSDQEIDDAILAHREELQAGAGDSERNLMLSGGVNYHHYEGGSPRRLSHSSSSASFSGPSLDSSHNDDSGSRLTHGTDIVFAGNVSSALRRHRCESEAESPPQLHAAAGSGPDDTPSSRPSSSHGFPDRPKTPARRVSITDTLDRAREFDAHTHKSRGSILDELKTWQLESAGSSHLGVARDVDTDFLQQQETSSRHKTSRRKGSVGGTSSSATAKLERRPKTSAGVLRTGGSVKEAFVEAAASFPPRPSSRGASLNQRNSSVPCSSAPVIDILVLDGSGHDDKRPCSPTKTTRGIFTTASYAGNALSRSHEWNLEVLSPKVDITTAKRHLPSSLTSKQQRERSAAYRSRVSGNEEGDADGDSDSGSDDESSACAVAASESTRSTPMPKSAFFNVSQSLDAIDKWRDEMEDTGDDATVLSIGELQQGCLSPRSTGTSSASWLNANGAGNQQQHSPVNRKQRRAQQQDLTFGPGSSERDQHIVQLLREKHDQLKTRDGFRGYFRGIEEARLERILREVFTDPDRVRRRMQLMSGLFRHELQR